MTIRWTVPSSNSPRYVVDIVGLSPRVLNELRRQPAEHLPWHQIFPVFVGVRGQTNLPLMLGVYRLTTNSVRFTPQFPLEPGLRYQARFDSAALPKTVSYPSATLSSIFVPPVAPVPETATVVAAVYPSADELPENLLKFYIQFSAPMSRGRVYEHIHLRDAGGKEIELPFLELDEELWNPALTRLTLFIDPGRIKREVKPLEEVGPSLESGKQYVLVIDGTLKDGAGNPLQKSFAKSFRVTPPDRTPLDPAHWKIREVTANTRQTLVVNFPKPMDYALASRMLHVVRRSGEPVPGKVSLTDQERQWGFVPDQSWSPGDYQLLVQTTLEDLAGNNIGKPFEVDLFEQVERKLSQSTISLPFAVASPR